MLESNHANISSKRKEAWEQIENLVLTYQKDIGSKPSQEAARELIKRFTPLFNKYLRILKYNEINFKDAETRRFIFSFIDKKLQKGYPKNIMQIRHRFYFITKTYGSLEETEILSDIYEIFLKMAKRYKQMDKNFCAYIHNVFLYEMSRTIKKFTSDLASINYKSYMYADLPSKETYITEEEIEQLDINWINGECACVFKKLTPLDRKIISYYYGETDYPDKKISELLNIHINTVNQRRRRAAKIILLELKQKELKIKRNRNLYHTSK